MQQVLERSVAQRRFQMMLVLLFAGAALALAAFGTYGVVSFVVARRRAEMGIRIALGAGRGSILRMVLRQGMTPVFAGLVVERHSSIRASDGTWQACFSRSVRAIPWHFRSRPLVLLVVAAAACLVPPDGLRR